MPVADAVIWILVRFHLGVSLSDIARNAGEAANLVWVASIPVVCLVLAGWLTGAHLTRCDQGAARNS